MDRSDRRRRDDLRASSAGRAIGFDLCGIAPAAAFPELEFLREWLRPRLRRRDAVPAALRGAALRRPRGPALGAIGHRARHRLQRRSSRTRPRTRDPGRAAIARYAWGDDYHVVIEDALASSWSSGCAARAGDGFEARAYVDTGPVQERVYAQHAGLGWIGKNTCLINPTSSARGSSCGDHHEPPARAGRAGARSVRHLHALPRRVPDGRAGRAARPRRDPLPFLPHDRDQGRDPGAGPRRCRAITSTAATSARTCAPGI